MKLARFVLKIVGASLAMAGAVCLVIGYWDRLMALCPCRLHKKRPSEYDDYADLDE